MPVTSTPPPRTAPVLAIMVCHDGAEWLPEALSALAGGTTRPRHIIAVDTGSTDETAAVLAEACQADDTSATPVLDGVLTLEPTTGFGAAVAHAVEYARQRWGDPGSWLWLLHDDSAPEPGCLDILLRSADASPSAGVLGPLAVDWHEPRLIVDAGISIDASGHRHQVVPSDVPEADDEAEVQPEQTTEVLAVPSAGALISTELWGSLEGFDQDIALLGEDIDFGWRANVAGSLVLCVPSARIRHARAVATGARDAAALSVPVRAADRAHGLRTLLVNSSALAFVVGVPRLAMLCVLRALGFALLRDGGRVHAELGAIGYLLGGAAGLRSARAGRVRGSVSGLFISRATRLRAALRGAVLQLVRRRVASEAVLGKLPSEAAAAPAWIPPGSADDAEGMPRPVGPDALPAGVKRPASARGMGLRKPADVVAVTLPQSAQPVERPSPGSGTDSGDYVFVEVSRRRIVQATVLAPPVVLAVVLSALALGVHWGRLGLDLAGGRLLPVGDLGQVFSTYLAAWHPVAGGTGAAAPVTLPLLGLLGAVFAPIGGPAALVALLLLGDIPLAGLSAYAASTRVPVHRWVRAAIAAAYALLPVATAAVASGRLAVVIVHILLPPLIAGIGAVLTRSGRGWLSVAVATALTLAVIGAFSPLAHAVALVGLLTGMLITRWPGGPMRATASVAIVVLLPVCLLLPWLPTLVRHPRLILHGLDGVGGAPASAAGLLGLDTGGAGALAVAVALLVAVAVAIAVRPTVRALPGFAVFVLGAATVLAVRWLEVPQPQGEPASPGYAGVGLLVAGAGLLMVLLGTTMATGSAWRRNEGSRQGDGRHAATATRSPLGPTLRRVGAAGGVAVLLALATGAVLAGREGPLRAGGGWELAPSLEAELDRTSRAALVLGTQQRPPRQIGARLPRFGDDAMTAVPGSSERLARWQRGLLAGSADAVTSAVAAGVLFVVMPQGHDGSNLRQSVPELVAPAPPTSDGRAVLRLIPVGGPVMLLAPVEAHLAVTEQAPSGELADGRGAAVVEAELPDVRVRVSEGPAGRLLVLAAELEPGWSATVNGKPVPIVRAWGHQVGVAVPQQQSEVVVSFPSARWDLLLLFQVAALLFALLTVIPGRGGATRPGR